MWLQGDNLADSTDSRYYGPVPMALIQGVVFARVYASPGWIPQRMPPPGNDDLRLRPPTCIITEDHHDHNYDYS